MSPEIERLGLQTRRHLLQTAGLGIGSMALHALMARDSVVAGATIPDQPKSGAKPPMIAPKAKRVIYLHMAGSPSQLELFEHKPDLHKLHMQDCPASFLEGKRFAFIKGVPKILAGQFSFKQYGESGQWISELLPQYASVVDKACVIRTVQTDQFNHAPSQLFIHTGTPRLGNPSLGSWINYGLGSVNENLPGFVVLLSGGKTPDAGKSLWGSGFLALGLSRSAMPNDRGSRPLPQRSQRNGSLRAKAHVGYSCRNETMPNCDEAEMRKLRRESRSMSSLIVCKHQFPK